MSKVRFILLLLLSCTLAADAVRGAVATWSPGSTRLPSPPSRYRSPYRTSAQQPRGMQISDLAALKDISDAQISPDGARVVFTQGEVSKDRTQTNTRLWVAPAAGGAPQRLTSGEANESNARWSPDGKQLAFFSDRDGKNGLWIVAAEGGQPRLAARVLRTNFHLKGAGESFTWAPDSQQIAFVSSPEILTEAPPAPTGANGANTAVNDALERVRRPLTREEIEQLPPDVRDMILRVSGQATGQTVQPSSPAITDALSKLTNDPRVITRLQYKARTTFSDNLQAHLFIVNLKTNQIRQLTDGKYYEHSPNWSPQGDEIVFVSNREPDPDKVNNSDLFIVNVANGAVRQLTKTKGCEWTPVFAPNGKEVAFTGTQRALTTIDSVAEDTHVFVILASGGEATELARELDRRVFGVKWAGDSGSLFFTASDHGKTLLYRVYKIGRLDPQFEHTAQISGFSIAKNDALALTVSDATHPPEVYATREPGRIAPLTKLNEFLIGTFRLATPREIKFDNDGLQIQGWLLPPVNVDENGKYPLLLSIHGGPHGMHGYSFNGSAQIMAGAGYGVLLINPRGSSGYGQKFADGCVNDWGGGDYRDLLKGVDVALAQFKFLDKDRLGVLGGSYGGYMTNWVVTQTDRFKAAAASASLANLISFYSTSLYQDLIHAEFNGQPWDNFDILWERSPLKHIKKAKTPLLLIHGEQDNDVHITQAEEMYTALRMRGIDCEFVRYPREGHGFREPRHREDQLARTLLWFEKYLKR